MPDVREKLVELLEKFVPTVWAEDCEGNRHPMCDDIRCAECIADRLIANGVTIQRWIPVKIEPPSYDSFNATMRFPDGEMVSGVAVYNEDGSWTPEYEGAEVTHWMNFPEPSKGDD